MKFFGKLFRLVIIAFFIASVTIFLANVIVNRISADRIYTSTESIPHHKVGLLLGTSKYVRGGMINLYYKYRIQAAARLYKAGKIDYILVSGDNGSKQYDEPTAMKADLISEGIPADKIYLDYAGFRTLDSIVRCKEIFGQQHITVISQEFHNERAIFLADHFGIDAVGYNARDVSHHYGAKTQARELLARVKMMIDLVIGKQPKYLGEQIQIG